MNRNHFQLVMLAAQLPQHAGELLLFANAIGSRRQTRRSWKQRHKTP